MGVSLIALAVTVGAGLATLLTAFPLPILAGMLATAGLLHIGLLRDLRGVCSVGSRAERSGAIGFFVNLAPAVVFGLVVWWLPQGFDRLRTAFGRGVVV